MASTPDPAWRTQILKDDRAFLALAEGLPPAELWSLLLAVMERRAAARTPAALLRQWQEDDFTRPAPLDQRALLRADQRLLEAAAAFEAIELSPLAPLGTCSALGLASQNKIVSALRGTEVLADPTNALALECARRLRQDPDATPRLVTCQRVVRAQRLPKLAQRSGFARHFAQHFRMFALATAGREVKDHGLLVAALEEHIDTHLAALDGLARDGCRFPGRALRLLATAPYAAVMDRVAARFAGRITVVRGELTQAYYHGVRFLISARAADDDVPLSDGGAFDWVARLTANQRLVFVASGMGTQLAVALFRGGPDGSAAA